jgi:hypothetical protein
MRKTQRRKEVLLVYQGNVRKKADSRKVDSTLKGKIG